MVFPIDAARLLVGWNVFFIDLPPARVPSAKLTLRLREFPGTREGAAGCNAADTTSDTIISAMADKPTPHASPIPSVALLPSVIAVSLAAQCWRNSG